jgi:hypothetical protein
MVARSRSTVNLVYLMLYHVTPGGRRLTCVIRITGYVIRTTLTFVIRAGCEIRAGGVIRPERVIRTTVRPVGEGGVSCITPSGHGVCASSHYTRRGGGCGRGLLSDL